MAGRLSGKIALVSGGATGMGGFATEQGRIGEPEDAARAALYLASDDSAFVTGQQLFVDNGFSAV